MIEMSLAAYIFLFLSSIVIIFQLCLAFGAPWGEMAMGGKFPGRYSPVLRVGALIQMLILMFMALVVLSRAELALNDYFEVSKTLIWIVVVIAIVSAVLNTITPSKKERLLWCPVTIVMAVCAVIVSMG